MSGVLSKMQKFMTKEQFIAEELAAEDAQQQERDEQERAKNQEKDRLGVARNSSRSTYPLRPTFTHLDFLPQPNAIKTDVKDWFDQFPSLGKRNFYLIQNHHATAKHCDLRIQLDGATVSFAVPKGLSCFAAEKKSRSILAIETNPHPINYTLFEGTGLGTSAVWDLGSYKMHATKSSLRKKAREEAEDTTDDEASLESNPAASKLPLDYLEEDLFYKGLCRGSFIAQNPRWGQKGRPVDRDPGHSRAFVIELNGTRYQRLQLRSSRTATDWRVNRPKGTPAEVDLLVRNNNWLIHVVEGCEWTESDLGAKSILSGRTMEEIKSTPMEIKGRNIDPGKGFMGEGDLHEHDWGETELHDDWEQPGSTSREREEELWEPYDAQLWEGSTAGGKGS